MSVTVIGAGAFGTALAIALGADGRPVRLLARDADLARDMQSGRENTLRLPGHRLPGSVDVAAPDNLLPEGPVLLALPMQRLAAYLQDHRAVLDDRDLVACCKGIDLASGLGPSGVIRRDAPGARPALLSGPSFADDIARGLPTALTIAAETEGAASGLQAALACPTLRFYRSTDLTGVEAGGALKNVMAIACGVAIGAGLGESARAALMTRGYAEMQRYALAQGARPETLAGLSGFGDLALTCTSLKSRNYRFGTQLGETGTHDTSETTEGIATARAIDARRADLGLDMPISAMVAALLDGRVSIADGVEALLSRPLIRE